MSDSVRSDSEIRIRTAVKEDAEQILEIYAYYIRETAITYEYDVPSIPEFMQRIETTLQRFPYIVAEQGGRIIGYAYAGYFKERAAYDRSVEMTIYLANDCKGNGSGRKLYEALEEILRQMHVTNVNACIAYPEKEDAYLDYQSAEFHEHLGYSRVGIFHNCAYKFDTWYHMIWMEKMIADHEEKPEEFIPFPEL